jgi:hypothetical protein
MNPNHIDEHRAMKSIPSHMLKDAVVIVPKGAVNLSFVLLVMLGGTMLAGLLIFLLTQFGRFSPIPLPIWSYPVFGCVPGFVVAFLCGWLDYRDSMLDVIMGRDTMKGEVLIVERRFGRPRAVVQIALARVQAIRIYWEVIYIGSGTSSNPAFGCWNAQLALLDATEVHLGHIKGKPDAPPDTWLTRFKRVSALLDKPLEILPSLTDAERVAPSPPVDALISKVREQSSSPSRIEVRFVLLIILNIIVVIAILYLSRLGK